MKSLTEHRLFGYFTQCMDKAGSVPAEELSLSFTGFAEYLSEFTTGQEISLPDKLRQLYRTQQELSLLLRLSAEHPGATVQFYLEKTAGLIETEIKLVYFMAHHPECQLSRQEETLSSFYWKGSLINLMELITSLYYSQMIADASGEHQSFAGLVSAFEKLFNVSIPKPYDLRADLSRRKKNLSVLLPKLRETFEKNIVSCGNGK